MKTFNSRISPSLVAGLCVLMASSLHISASTVLIYPSNPGYLMDPLEAPVVGITLTRSDTSKVEMVSYYTLDGSAKAGVDYVAKSGTVTFAIGEGVRFIQIPLIDSGLLTPWEQFTVVLTNASSGVELPQSQVTV